VERRRQTPGLLTSGSVPPSDAPATPAEPEAKPKSRSRPKPHRRHLVLDICIIVGVAVLYVLSLVGYHWLASSPGPLPKPDVGTTSDTVVLVRFEALHTVGNRLDVKVLAMQTIRCLISVSTC